MRRLGCLCLCLALLPLPALAGDTLTRGEALLRFWEAGGSVPYDVTAHPFTDLAGREDLAQAAAWGWGLGLIRGVGEGRFDPDRPLTREELSVLLRRWDGVWGRETSFPDLARCNDYADCSPWAGDDLYWACATGRMEWRQGRLAPGESVTAADLPSLTP